jgi:hypothetical protein
MAYHCIFVPVGVLVEPSCLHFHPSCLVLVASGVFSAAWLLAIVHKKVAKCQVGKVYIGTPEERSVAAKKAEDADELALEAQEESKTAMYDSVPTGASVALFFVLMYFRDMIEGMQITLFAVVIMPRGGVSQPFHRLCQLPV